MAFNMRDPILKDVRVRQALAYAIDRRPMLEYLWRGFAQPAASIFRRRAGPTTATCPSTTTIPSAPASCSSQAGYPATVNGVRFHLTMKTSTDENTRLMAAVLQQQLRQVGIELDIRTFEFAHFLLRRHPRPFQLYSLRWIGGNEDPDIFEYAFHSSKFTPNGANRGFYSNPRVDALIDQARNELDQEQAQTALRAKSSASWPTNCLTSISGISTMCWCTRSASRT